MKLHEECGVFACVVKDNKAFEYIKYGLSLLQHRGQESAGISTGDNFYTTIKDTGMVDSVFKGVNPLKGNFGLGHVRYSTQGLSNKAHAQPFCALYKGENIAVAHNGNILKSLSNIQNIQTETLSDTEIILKSLITNINKRPSDWQFKDITGVLIKNFIKGAYSLVIALPERIIGIKDINGFRPLMFCIADEGYFLASEDCAFNSLNIHKVIEINAGEYIEITKSGYEIKKYYTPKQTNQCVFEHIYFANPSSRIFNKNVYETRVELGRLMANEEKIFADVVVPVMNSGLSAAIGYSEISKIPMHLGLKRNNAYRSFIQPDMTNRERVAKEKYIPIKSVIENKKIILVDDSIVRGTTMFHLAKLLKNQGAKEIHIRLSSPAIVNTCLWGIDIPDREELIYTKFMDNDKLADYIGVNSIKFLSKESFKKVFMPNEWCYNCFETH